MPSRPDSSSRRRAPVPRLSWRVSRRLSSRAMSRSRVVCSCSSRVRVRCCRARASARSWSCALLGRHLALQLGGLRLQGGQPPLGVAMDGVFRQNFSVQFRQAGLALAQPFLQLLPFGLQGAEALLQARPLAAALRC